MAGNLCPSQLEIVTLLRYTGNVAGGMTMEFKHIEYFIDTCSYKSMSQAAEALFISQQALSRCIANMEEELGCRLFSRTSKGSTLTEEGKYFYDQFQPLVQNYRSTLSQTTSALAHRPRTVRFACAPQVFRALDASLLLSFQEQHPEITLERLEMSDKDVDRFVDEDEGHFGLLAIPENRHGQRFAYVPLKTLPLCLYVHRDSPLAQAEAIDFAMLKDEQFLTLEKRSHYHSLLNEKAKEAGFTPNKRFASADMDQLFSLVNSGKGVFIAVDIPAVRTMYPNIVVRPFSDETINYSIGVIFQDYEKLDRASKKFIEYIVESMK